MSSSWMRRVVLALVAASALFLAACGSGTIESQLKPTRVVSFGDSSSDLGQTGSRYTVNDGSVSIWAEQMALSFGLPLNTLAKGGTSYATGNARIKATPDAAGNSATPTVTQQIDSFLAGNTIGASDLMVISAGTADIISEVGKLNARTQTTDQALENVKQAGRDLGALVRRLVQAGGAHVVVVGAYDLSKSPWATSTKQVDVLAKASAQFNEQLLLSMVDLGANALYVDAALFYNLVVGTPANYGLTNATVAACTSVDPGPGIGIGAGQVNSALCNPGTIASGVDYTVYTFADLVYQTPAAQRKFGDYAYQRIHERW
jgi:outer membrane lipase/esterase